jgi:hypothetical protein
MSTDHIKVLTELAEHFEQVPNIWRTTPVDQVPELRLSNWAILELPDGDRHFAGYNLTEYEGRASSKIVEFDGERMRGITASGRVYELVGAPGLTGDGLYVWNQWKRINRVNEYTDISDRFYKKESK